jgi:hypothetical protein
MFFVMGITWIADVLTFGLQWAFGAENIKAVSLLKRIELLSNL